MVCFDGSHAQPENLGKHKTGPRGWSDRPLRNGAEHLRRKYKAINASSSDVNFAFITLCVFVGGWWTTEL